MLHPHQDLGEESRLGLQWMTNFECASPQYVGDNMQLLHTIPSPNSDHVFSFPSTSSEASPHMSHLAVSDGHSNGDSGSPRNEGGGQKTTLRRSQNRQAQRRFRERKEQQKASLLTQLETLQSKHDKMSDLLLTMRQSNISLESNKTRLESEVEALRKWREKILGVMQTIVKPDGEEDDLLMKVATSCAVGCWRWGMEYSRTVIVMQTLLGIFGEADGESLAVGGEDTRGYLDGGCPNDRGG
ncbi:hypothetical protein BJX70DRAFT_114863 [Aspergillus crustosus]